MWNPGTAIRLLLLLTCLALPLQLWAAAKAVFDRTSIFVDETVNLILEVDQQIQNESPDLSPLQADFRIVGQRTSSQVQINNGQQTAQTRWIIQLEPKHSGTIRLPALTIAGEQTAAVTLTVKERPAEDAKQVAENLFLEVQAQPESPYVQSQIRYTIRFYYSVPLLEGNLAEPEPRDAVVERLGEDIAYQTSRNGRRYNVIERNYAIFPEKSGELSIPAITFQGRIADQGRSQSRLLGLASRRLRLNSDPLLIQVRPRPADYKGKHWLPSAKLTLEERWPQQPPQLRVGEPVTRTLTLNAQGLNANQLPSLPIPEIPHIRTYSDQPTTQDSHDNTWIFGRREQRVAVVPSKAGEFTLPEIRLHWWDTENDKPQVALIPARSITVLPAANAPNQPLPQETPAVVIAPTPQVSAAPTAGIWPWISAALLCLWLLTLAAWWRKHRADKPVSTITKEAPAIGNARRALRQACRDNNAPAAAKALVAWAAAQWPQSPPHNLGALAARLARGADAVRELDRHLYASSTNPWQGATLWEELKQGLVEQRKNGSTPCY